jgi:hypothetical protein
VVTHTTLWATIYLLASGFSPLGWQVFAAAVGVRTAVGGLIASRVFGVPRIARRLPLLPFKDLFISMIWALAFLGNTVRWGGITFEVERNGRMRPLPEPEGAPETPEPEPAGKVA